MNVDIFLLVNFSMLYFSRFKNLLIMRLLLVIPIVLIVTITREKVLMQLTQKVKVLLGKCLNDKISTDEQYATKNLSNFQAAIDPPSYGTNEQQ